MAYKGKFVPKNRSKYRGNPDNIIWRSTWELKCMKYLDENVNVLEWSSEEVIIRYRSPVDNMVRRYFPDFYAKVRQKDGTIKEMLLEVKPKAQTMEPAVQKRKTKKYIKEVMTWAVNQAKWKQAEEYCLDRGWKFHILTENDLGIR